MVKLVYPVRTSRYQNPGFTPQNSQIVGFNPSQSHLLVVLLYGSDVLNDFIEANIVIEGLI